MSDDIKLTVAWFAAAVLRGEPALGEPETMSWEAFASVFEWRREGEKDGCNFVPARFQPEPAGREVRRLKRNLLARTAVALDIETNKKTGEVPPSPAATIARAKAHGLACLLYTSHSHRPDGDVRFRVVVPLTAEIAHDLPAPEIVADHLGMLGVLDLSKIGAASLFYLPSCPPGSGDQHQTVLTAGAPIDATWLTATAGALMAGRQAEADRIAIEAQAEAAARREAKIASGFDPDDSLIEKLRSRFDLDSVLTTHGYDKMGGRYRHQNSRSGCYGASIKTLGGIERVFSHNGTDPLHADNLPAWATVKAIDAFDVMTILDFGGDRTRALRELSDRFHLNKAQERKAIATLLFGLIRQQATQETIKASAFAEGARLGLSREEVCSVAAWVGGQVVARKAG